MSNKIITIMPDEKKVYKYLGKPTLYFPLGDAAIQPYLNGRKMEFIPNVYFNDIYYIEK